RASAYRRALKRQSGIFAEPHAGIIPLKRRSASYWKACVARTALLSCAARKGSIRTCNTVGRRSSWRRARNGSPATRRVRRPRTRSTQKKRSRGWGGRFMRYSASEKFEIIELVQQSSLSIRRTLAPIGIPRSTFRQSDDRPKPALADRLHLTEGHRLGLVLSVHRAR